MNLSHANLLKVAGLTVTGDIGPYTFYTTKRKAKVAFIKAPPKTPPSSLQIHRRNQFRLAGMAWKSLTDVQRSDWHEATRRAGLKITAFNLFLHWHTTKDLDVIRTVEQQSGIDLLA